MLASTNKRGGMLKKDTKTRQAEIVSAAIVIIGETGVRGLTTARLAGRLGMSEPNLYRHFADKQAILCAVVDEIGRAIAGKAETIAGMDMPADMKLKKIMESHVREVEAKCGIPRLVFSEEVHVTDTALRDRLVRTIGAYMSVIERVVSEGVDKGVFKKGLGVPETARTFLGMVQFMALRWSLSGFAFPLEVESRRLWDNFHGMIKK
jgi:AcrR family transcriptional regulator